MEIKNIFLTGKKRSGKSTMINNILNELDINYSGYRTLPYYINNEARGFYLNGYVDCVGNNSPISIKIGEEKCIPIIESFDVVGASILEKSIECSNTKLILLDEIGRLESNAYTFKKRIVEALDSEKVVLGVLQKAENEFLIDIIKREDTVVFDIDNLTNYEINEVNKMILDIIKLLLKG